MPAGDPTMTGPSAAHGLSDGNSAGGAGEYAWSRAGKPTGVRTAKPVAPERGAGKMDPGQGGCPNDL